MTQPAYNEWGLEVQPEARRKPTPIRSNRAYAEAAARDSASFIASWRARGGYEGELARRFEDATGQRADTHPIAAFGHIPFNHRHMADIDRAEFEAEHASFMGRMFANERILNERAG